jgi:nucleotidyltransferase/DNA polymerase involved in DNA repair
MFQNVSQSYTLADASSEIALMLLWAFILGMMLWWLLKPSDSNSYEEEIIEKSPMKDWKEDDLQLIEGVGPAIEKLLKKHGIQNFEDMVNADVSGLEEILEEGWSRFKKHVPTTWPDQARLADKGKWSELEEYQDILNAGK